MNGLDKIIMRQDMYAAIQRLYITHDETELRELTKDQLIMYREVAAAKPGDDLWRMIDDLIGEKMPA